MRASELMMAARDGSRVFGGKISGGSAAFRFRLAAHRLILALRYNPNWHLQPRVPAGNPDGGQWTRMAEALKKAEYNSFRATGLRAFRSIYAKTRRLAVTRSADMWAKAGSSC